jgi:hypothetical protein
MEVNVNFVFFEELQDRSEDSGAILRVVVVREGKNLDDALEAASTDFFPLQLD